MRQSRTSCNVFDNVWDIRIDLYIALGLLSENEGVEARNMDRP